MKDEFKTQPSRTRKRHRRRLLGALLSLVVAFVVIFGGFGIWAYHSYEPPSVHSGKPVNVIVNPGESVATIGSNLERQGLIRSALVFRLYVRYAHPGETFKAGTYAVAPGSQISEIVAQMTEGEVAPASIRVTIPEGFTVSEIANRLAADNICSSQSFINEEQSGLFKEPFISALPKKADVKYRLEGYLFPDTYEFQKGESAHDVIDSMLEDFQTHMDDAHIIKALQTKNESLSALITKASMVEREAKVQHDRPLIASVINNRLSRHMKLQIDATIQYILGHRDIVTDKDLTVNDPYNTYQHYGLPPGPIGSPGMASIEAALSPATTKYLYYVAKYDGSGESYFSSTEAQHLANIQKSQANLHAHGGK